MNLVRIRYVANSLLSIKAKSITHPKSISYDPQIPSLRIESINLTWQLRPLSEVLLVTIAWIRKPYAAVLGHNHIIHRIEISPMPIGHHSFGWSSSWHVTYSSCPRSSCALCTEQYAILIVHSSVRHVNARRWAHLLPIDLLNIVIFSAIELDARDQDCRVGR